QLLVDDAAGVAHTRLGMAARHVDALDDEPAFTRKDPQNLARFALVAAADPDDGVALFGLPLRPGSQPLGGQRGDPQKTARPQCAGHRAKHAGADRLALAADQDRGVAVETDGAAVRAADFLCGADDDSAVDIALFDAAARDRLLDRDDDDIADG